VPAECLERDSLRINVVLSTNPQKNVPLAPDTQPAAVLWQNVVLLLLSCTYCALSRSVSARPGPEAGLFSLTARGPTPGTVHSLASGSVGGLSGRRSVGAQIHSLIFRKGVDKAGSKEEGTREI
jgi:hypothetical protein